MKLTFFIYNDVHETYFILVRDFHEMYLTYLAQTDNITIEKDVHKIYFMTNTEIMLYYLAEGGIINGR